MLELSSEILEKIFLTCKKELFCENLTKCNNNDNSKNNSHKSESKFELMNKKNNYCNNKNIEEINCNIFQDLKQQNSLLIEIESYMSENSHNNNNKKSISENNAFDILNLDECNIRTDSKYLSQIKKIESSMFLEDKRKLKYKNRNLIKIDELNFVRNCNSPIKNNNFKEKPIILDQQNVLPENVSTRASESTN